MRVRFLILLCSVLFCNLRAEATLQCVPNEIERLTLILTKYGNNPYNISPLHYAILENDKTSVDLLLKYGASPYMSKKFPDGCTCLTFAIISGNLDLVEQFLDLNYDEARQIDPLLVAIRFRKNEIAKYLIDKMAKAECSEQKVNMAHGNLKDIHFEKCLEMGNVEIYSYLSDLIQLKDQSLILLKLICPSGYDEFGSYDEMDVINQNKLKMLRQFYYENKLLIDKERISYLLQNVSPATFEFLLDSNILKPNERLRNRPVLHLAIENHLCAYELAKILLEKGADPNSLDCFSNDTPLHKIAYANNSSLSIEMRKQLINLFLSYGADINIRNIEHVTPLDYAHRDIKDFLISLGAKPGDP